MIRIKNSKKGVAMVMALIVSVLALVIATSYLGITGAGTRAARNYKNEAIALNLAQSGLEAVINAMGNRDNWGDRNSRGPYDTNRFIPSPPRNNIVINLLPANNDPKDPNLRVHLNDNNRIRLEAVPPQSPVRPMLLGFVNPHTAFNNAVEYYRTNNAIALPGDNSGVFYVAVVPEPANGFNPQMNVSNVNINYAVAIASFVYRRDSVIPAVNANPFTNDLIASRMIKVRTSFAFPGSVYQNARAFDVPPNPRDFIFGAFGYPNFRQLTADACFMDENSTWDGGIRVDGALTSGEGANRRRTWGAPQLTDEFDRTNGFVQGAESNTDRPGMGLAGDRYDTSGSKKISFINDNNLNNRAIGGNLNPADRGNIIQFNKTLSTQQGTGTPGIVYFDIMTGTNHYNTQNLQNSIMSPNAAPDIGKNDTSNIIDSFWLNNDAAGVSHNKLNRIDDNGDIHVGLMSQIAQPDNSQPWVQRFGVNDLRPDPLYAYQKIEAPTIRITVDYENTNGVERNRYTMHRIEYGMDAAGNAYEQATQMAGSPFYSGNNSNFKGLIYIEGANVQVKGGTQAANGGGHLVAPLTIVSDTSPEFERQNLLAARGQNVPNATIRNDIEFPNILNGNQFQFLDIVPNNGILDANPLTPTQNTPIFAALPVANQPATNPSINGINPVAGRPVFPPVDKNLEQPMGNISVIGDLARARGNNEATLALVAPNRIYLNDFGHRAANSTNNNLPDQKAQITANDGILKLDALVASREHNMTMDFNNFSKNLEYTKSNNYSQIQARLNSNNTDNRAPGYAANAMFDIRSNDNNPYNTFITDGLAERLALPVNSNTRLPNAVRNVEGINVLNNYMVMNAGARNMLWRDFYFGAVKVNNTVNNNVGLNDYVLTGRNGVYSQGLFDFTGAVISRFADIEADTGDHDAASGGRINQMGYPAQHMSFDSNLLERGAPYFTTTTTAFSAFTAGSTIRWTILSYVDSGAISYQQRLQ